MDMEDSMTEERKKKKKKKKVGGIECIYATPNKPAYSRPGLAVARAAQPKAMLKNIMIGMGPRDCKNGGPVDLYIYHEKGARTHITGTLTNVRAWTASADIIVAHLSYEEA